MQGKSTTRSLSNETWLGPGEHTRIKRHAERARYDAATVHAIIDEALVCQVSFVLDGQPFALPTAHARIEDTVYLHGAIANQMCRSLALGARVCLGFTLIDGLVFARDAFSHSMNYRSVSVFGNGREVTDGQEKRVALHALVEHVAPGRMAEMLDPSDAQVDATLVIAVKIEEAAAKLRTGQPLDSDAMAATSSQWAGVLPLKLTAQAAQRDPRLPMQRAVAASVQARAVDLGGEAIVEACDGDLLFSSDKQRLDVAMVHRFLCDESYWASGVSREGVQRSIDASLCFGVYRSTAQIGFARVLSDGARFGYLGDVFVIETERGKGIGKRLVDFVLGHPLLRDIDRLLLGTRDAHSLYARHGFINAPADRYMVKPGPRLAR